MAIRERPKNFKDWEVLALLDNRKTQFREVVKTPKKIIDFYLNGEGQKWTNAKIGDFHEIGYEASVDSDGLGWFLIGGYPDNLSESTREGIKTGCKFPAGWDGGIKCPYGKIGDRIWGRETWAEITGFVDPCIDAIIDGYFYRANYLGLGEEPKWRSPVTMPRSASRIVREITDIRIERLQDISEEDCLAEGIKYQGNAFDTISAFAETRKDWDSDSFVWVYHIKKIEND